MQKSKKSVKRLDKHQTDCNGLSKRIDKTTKIIKEIRPNNKDLVNIAETYRNKILEIDQNLENKSIDFWDGIFELRKAIIFNLQEKLGIGIFNILKVANQVSLMATSETMTKTNKKRRARYITKAVYNLNTANSYIENYNLDNNINETLITYFLNSEYKNNFYQIYSKMKENLKDLGLEDPYIEAEIMRIIEYRIEHKDNYKQEDLLTELYPELIEEEQSARTRTL